MIRLVKNTTALACTLIWCASISAQDLKEDLLKVAERYDQSAFKMEVKMEVRHWDNSLPSVTNTGNVKRKGENYYTNFDGQVNLINKKYSVMVTEEDREIIYAPVQKINRVKTTDKSVLPDSKLLNNDIKLVSRSSDGKVYEVKRPQLGMTKMRLKIGSDNTLKKVHYYYEKTEDSPVKEVVITYNNIVFNPSFSATDFSEKKYFNQVNGEVILSSAYKDYNLVKGGY